MSLQEAMPATEETAVVVAEPEAQNAPPAEQQAVAAPPAPQAEEFPVEGVPIILMKDYVAVEVHGMTKYISYAALSDIINRHCIALEQDAAGNNKGMSLPTNCSWIGMSKDYLEVNFFYPECVREITYHSTKMKIVVPNIIIYHKLRKQPTEYRVELTRYFCTDRTGKTSPRACVRSIDHNNGIYLLPFSNTYDQGHMCYGSNSMPVKVGLEELNALWWFYEFLFQTPFNDDLGIRSVGNISVNSWYNLLAKEAKQPEPKFPYYRLRGHREYSPSDNETAAAEFDGIPDAA